MLNNDLLEQLMDVWQFWGVLSVFTLIGFYLSYRVALKRSKHEFAPPVIFQLVGAAAIIPLFFFSNEPLPFLSGQNGFEIIPLIMFLFAGFFYAVHDRTQGTVRTYIDVAVSGVIDLSVHVFLILFGLLFLKEQVAFQNVLGIILIMIANFNVAYDFRSHSFNKYWSLGIFANMTYALGIIVDMSISDGRNLPFYLVLNYSWIALLITLFAPLTEKLTLTEVVAAIRSDFHSSNWLPHVLSGVFSVYYTFVMLMGYRVGDVSIVTAFISTTVIFNTILAAIFLKERDMLVAKFVSAIVGVIGMILLIVDI